MSAGAWIAGAVGVIVIGIFVVHLAYMKWWLDRRGR